MGVLHRVRDCTRWEYSIYNQILGVDQSRSLSTSKHSSKLVVLYPPSIGGREEGTVLGPVMNTLKGHVMLDHGF